MSEQRAYAFADVWLVRYNLTQSSRALGWDTNDYTMNTYRGCGNFSALTFTHTGYTGVCAVGGFGAQVFCVCLPVGWPLGEWEFGVLLVWYGSWPTVLKLAAAGCWRHPRHAKNACAPLCMHQPDLLEPHADCSIPPTRPLGILGPCQPHVLHPLSLHLHLHLHSLSLPPLSELSVTLSLSFTLSLSLSCPVPVHLCRLRRCAGTEMCCDPTREVYTVLFTNRCYPDKDSGIQALRQAFNNAVLGVVNGSSSKAPLSRK